MFRLLVHVSTSNGRLVCDHLGHCRTLICRASWPNRAKMTHRLGKLPLLELEISRNTLNRAKVRGLHTDSGMGGGKLGKLMHAYFVII
jgi:hypothetical protein